MTIFKTANMVETYRARAKYKDINELNDRPGGADATRAMMERIAENLSLNEDSVFVDVGCGSAGLLKIASEKGVNGCRGRLIGLLPTREEVGRVRNHLLHDGRVGDLISIEQGFAEDTGLPDAFASILVCNNVLHGAGQTLEKVKSALAEFSRIAQPGATIFIGEIPDSDELAGRTYGDSILAWLIWVLRRRGLKSFVTQLQRTLVAAFTKEPLIIAPKHMFYMAPDAFIALLSGYDIEVKAHFKLKVAGENGGLRDSLTRWNYVAVKSAAGAGER